MKAKIVVADDEPRIRELIREHLEHEGFQCEEATDGSAALAALRPHYLLTPPGLRQPAPGTPDEDAVRRVHIPLADTLAVSRLLEQGFCGTALYDGADGQPALRLERPNPA